MRRASSAGTSRRSGTFLRGSTTVRIPARSAASAFSRTPPTGSTRPRSVTSPVIATSWRTGMPVASETSAVAIVTPADGPSFGIAPAGTCTWISWRASSASSRPSSASRQRAKVSAACARLLHHVAELAGQHEPAAGGVGRLDAQHLAAGLGPGEPVRDADLADSAGAGLAEDGAAGRASAASAAARRRAPWRASPSAARRATLRHTAAIWRSRSRTPASRV